jgi:hypothetical protein
MGHITGCTFGGNSMQRCLNDRIRLRMNGADTVSIYHEVTNFIAMTLPGGRAVESCRKNAFIQNKHTTDEGAITGAAF